MPTPPRTKVIVSGVGAVTSQGPDARSFWENVRDGVVAIRPVQHMPMDGYRTRIAGEVEKVPTPGREYRRPDGFADRALEFALQAADEAFTAGGVELSAVPAQRWGVVLGTCNAGLLAGREWYLRLERGEQPDPMLAAQSTPQALAEALAGAFGFKGPVLSVDTACAAGANAIGYGADLIRHGRADAVMAGGTDALSDVLVGGFNSLESLSPVPAAPYSRDRQGLSLGEGSGMLLLLREDLARELGAPVLAEVAGYGLSADGYHPTAPHPEGVGAARALRAALRAAGERPERVDYVNSHGTGTAKNDPAETRATKVGLGEEAARRAALSSTKSMVGHLLGAAGAVEGLITVEAIHNQIAPPTANFTEPDPDCDLDYVPNHPRPMTIDVAVSNNFAFGGANASVVLRSPEAGDVPPDPATDRVVITGIGAITPAGVGAESLYDAVAAGSPLAAVEDGVQVARTDLRPGDWLKPKDRKRVDRLGLFSVIATMLLLEDAGLEVDDDNRERVGVVLGTGVGPMESMEEFARLLFEEGPSGANPAVFPNTVYNAAAGQVAIKLGVIGPSSTVTAGHAAGASALAYAAELVRDDHADAMVALAADGLTDTVLRAYRELGVLAGEEGEGGFALGEGVVALLLERQAWARSRGARVLGELLGSGVASDARGMGRWDPSGDGVERAVRAALDDAGLGPDDVESVYSSAAGLATADDPERAALQRVFGDGKRPLDPKRVTGEPMGVGGMLNAAVALTAFARGEHTGPALITSSSLGGTHFAVVVAPAER